MKIQTLKNHDSGEICHEIHTFGPFNISIDRLNPPNKLVRPEWYLVITQHGATIFHLKSSNHDLSQMRDLAYKTLREKLSLWTHLFNDWAIVLGKE